MSKRDFPVKSINCNYCGDKIDCYSNAQKYCLPEDNPACYHERVTKTMTDRQFSNYTGVPYEELLKLKSE